MRYRTLFKDSIVFILPWRYNTTPFRHLNTVSTADTSCVSANVYCLSLMGTSLPVAFLKTLRVYCQHLCHDGRNTLLTHLRIPSEIFSVVEWDWPWPALLRAASTPLSIATVLINLDGNLEMNAAYQERLAVRYFRRRQFQFRQVVLEFARPSWTKKRYAVCSWWLIGNKLESGCWNEFMENLGILYCPGSCPGLRLMLVRLVCRASLVDELGCLEKGERRTWRWCESARLVPADSTGRLR